MKYIVKGLGFVVLCTLLIALSAVALTQEATIEVPSGDGQPQAEIRIFRASIVIDRRGVVHRQPVREVTHGDPVALQMDSTKGPWTKGIYYGESNIEFEGTKVWASGESKLLEDQSRWFKVCARVIQFTANGDTVSEPFDTCGPRKYAGNWIRAELYPALWSGCTVAVLFSGDALA